MEEVLEVEDPVALPYKPRVLVEPNDCDGGDDPSTPVSVRYLEEGKSSIESVRDKLVRNRQRIGQY
jgi:hypothetical protein